MVGTYLTVDQTLHLAQLRGRHLPEVRKVETQVVGCHERTLLLDMRAQHLAQRSVEQVRGRMVVGRSLPLGGIYHRREIGGGILRQFVDDMDNQTVLLVGGHHVDLFVGILDEAHVADLTARIAVEGRPVEDQLVGRPVLGRDATVARDAHRRGQRIVTDELALREREQLLPVVGSHRGGVARTLLLRLQLRLESTQVDLHVLLAGDQLRQVDRETVGIIEHEGVVPRNLAPALFLDLGDHAVEQCDTRGQRPQERTLLLLDHTLDERLLRPQFGELVAHLCHQPRHQLADEGLGET